MASTNRLYRVAKSAIVFDRKQGTRRAFHPGPAVYAEDHPDVRAYPGVFVEVIVEGVEAATAAPGEKRNVSRRKS